MSSTPDPHGISAGFEWTSDYDTCLEQIASTDVVEIEWTKLRDIIKYKVQKNIELYLSQPPPPKTPKPGILSEQTTPGGGLRLSPFPPRKRDELNNYEAPFSFMNKQQAEELKSFIFAQLHQFDDSPPFTIQRVCELCINPVQQYKSVGKYLRAVEKSILITSTYASFPPLPQSGPTTNATPLSSYTPLIAPATPLFSPIPFLHEDARRSKSRSPPPSPFALNATGNQSLGSVEPLEGTALGLVDELDDPKPGHMSDHPTALTATTTLAECEGKGRVSKPFLGSLEQRFTKSESGAGASTEEDMTVDEAEVDKENKG